MEQQKLLIVEDDVDLAEALQDTLSLHGYQTWLASDGQKACQVLQEQMIDLILSDVSMPNLDGIGLLQHIQRHYPQIPVILMTAYGKIADAVAAIKLGARDYLVKPFEPDLLLDKIKRFAVSSIAPADNVIAEDKQSQQLLSLARKAAASHATVLISGESGTGKEVLARYIHDHSPRCKKPFIAINCAAIPENMLEATLFGYEKGAFTGAQKSYVGKFEQAQGGSLLLDEITEMDLNLQAKLLRVLQENEVERLGGSKVIALDVRVIATSNRDLLQTVAAGKFREDLFYRLNVFPLIWPPLRQRRGDILPLAEYLLQRHAQQAQRPIPIISVAAQQVLEQYDWPGNVREMNNVIQRALILQHGEEITVDDIHLQSLGQPASTHAVSAVVEQQDGLASDLQSREFQLIVNALKSCQGNRQQVADKLGISPRTLRYKLAKIRESGIELECER